MGHDDFYVSFVDYVAALVSGIDVPISVEMNDDRAQVHNGFPPHHGRRAEWLRALSYVSAGTNSRAARLIDPLVTRLREIRHNNVCYGLAAISTVRAGLCDFLSAKSVGGLTVRDGNPTHDGFVGVIDYLPNSAKREPGEIAAPRGAIEAWLLEQVDLLEDGDLSAFDSVLASYSLCGFDYDPINVLQGVPVINSSGQDFWPLPDLSSRLRTGHRLGFRVSDYGVLRLEQNAEPQSIPDISTCLVLGAGKFNDAEMSEAGPIQRKSLVGVIHRALVSQGANPTWKIHPQMYRGVFGKCDCLEVQI